MKSKTKKYKIIVGVVVVYVITTILLSHGKTYFVESSEPIEDIVVVCKWSSATRGLHGGTHTVTRHVPYVIKSGEEFSCGFNWLAPFNVSFKSSAEFKHPTHRIEYKKETKASIFMLNARNNLDILKDQQNKFVAGEWGTNQTSGTRYANSIIHVCGFPQKYFKHYSATKNVVDIERFRVSYDESMYQCLKIIYAVLGRYDRGFPKGADARIIMDKKWEKLSVKY